MNNKKTSIRSWLFGLGLAGCVLFGGVLLKMILFDHNKANTFVFLASALFF